MEKDVIKAQYQKSADHPIPTPAKRPRLTQREAQIKQRFRNHEADGVTRVGIVFDASDPGMTPDVSIDAATSAPAKHRDPVGWLLKRFGLLFLAALAIAIVLLMALPHEHAQTSHSAHLRPRALYPSRL